MQLFLSKIFSSTTPPAGDWLWSHPANCSKTHFLSSKMPANQHMAQATWLPGEGLLKGFRAHYSSGYYMQAEGRAESLLHNQEEKGSDWNFTNKKNYWVPGRALLKQPTTQRWPLAMPSTFALEKSVVTEFIIHSCCTWIIVGDRWFGKWT